MKLEDAIRTELERLARAATLKVETAIDSPQDALVRVDGRDLVMLASNNYLGLANHPRILEAAIRGIRDYGYGVSSVRFICGTLTIHRELEERLAAFLGTGGSILFSSCYAANEAFFASIVNEPLGSEEHTDVIYSDRLNHASIIDGTRLCRSSLHKRRIYAHSDPEDLGRQLAQDASTPVRFRFIATDGVFSMEGDLAPLDALVRIAAGADAILFVDDSHGVGVVGPTGRGTPEALGVHGQIPVLSGTLGKALGGAAGGYVAADRDLIEYLRQKARPYTFSNSLPPPIVMAALEAIRLLEDDSALIERLRENTVYLRAQLQSLGFDVPNGTHPIIPIMLGEASLAMKMSRRLLEEGVYIKGLWFPVVPQGEARLRAQVSAALERTHLDRALAAFEAVGRSLSVI